MTEFVPGDMQKAYDDWHVGRGVNLNADEIWHRKIVEASNRSVFWEKHVLEIGCGRGGFALWLASSSFAPAKLTAMDFSEEAVSQARAAAAGIQTATDLNFSQGDIMNISFADATFDTVISCETIEHVPDPRRAVRELARVLKPGGQFLLTTPNYFNPFGIWRLYRKVVGRPYTEAGQPINHFVMLPTTLRWVRDAGIHIQGFGSAEYLVPRWKRPPAHFEPPSALKSAFRYFGLQSWIIGNKPRSTK